MKHRWVAKARFVQAPSIPEIAIECLNTIPARSCALPSSFAGKSRSHRTNAHAKFETEDSQSWRFPHDVMIHGAIFLEYSAGHLADIGSQAGKRWRFIEKPFPKNGEIFRENVIIPWGGSGASYGDFLIQVLPKLARILVSMPEMDRINATLSLPFFPCHAWARPYLTILGFTDDRILDGSSPVCVPTGGRVFVGSGPSSRHGIAHPDDIHALLDLIEPQLGEAPSRPWRRLYISRKTGRTMANESDLLPGLRDRGFEVAHLENLTVPEQIRLFREAVVIAGPHGAGHANILWTPPGASLLEVFDPSWMHPCYAIVSQLRGIDYHCLVGEDGSSLGSWSTKSRFGIFESPRISPAVFFEKIDSILQA